ncbi:hypothetical protein [Micromonospora sp. NPDC049679]|uniref:hypothetical protein n=1 Tax=Micromonospora sp. NPDC049679 TaxID=3155920 RepID=UPI0033FD9907
MIVLAFTLPPVGSAWRETWSLPVNRDPITVSEMDLRYKYFAANVEMTVNDVPFIRPSGPEPIIDLGLSFKWVEKRLALGEDVAFGFTEHHEVIHLRGAGPIVSIESSELPHRAEADRSTLLVELARFTESVYQRLVEDVAGIGGNPVVQRLRPSA